MSPMQSSGKFPTAPQALAGVGHDERASEAR